MWHQLLPMACLWEPILSLLSLLRSSLPFHSLRRRIPEWPWGWSLIHDLERSSPLSFMALSHCGTRRTQCPGGTGGCQDSFPYGTMRLPSLWITQEDDFHLTQGSGAVLHSHSSWLAKVVICQGKLQTSLFCSDGSVRGHSQGVTVWYGALSPGHTLQSFFCPWLTAICISSSTSLKRWWSSQAPTFL